MRRALGYAFLALLLSPFLLWACLRLGALTPLANLIIRRQLDGRSALQVRLGSLRSDLHSFVEADDVVVLAPLDSGAKVPLLTLSSLRLEIKAYQAWRGRLPWSEALRLARLKGLNVFVLRSADGAWNLRALSQGPSKKKEEGAQALSLVIPAGRVELEDSQVVVNDELRDFRATIEGIQGTLDTRSLPLIAFSLNARTEGHAQENLSMAGEWDQRDHGLDARLDLANVGLASYLNYLLPEGSVRFEDGTASLSARLSRGDQGRPWSASGRARLSQGRLRIPGVSEPVDRISGSVDFEPHALRFSGLSARFLGADWSASGSLDELRHPVFNVALSNALLDLSELTRQVKGMDALDLTGTALVSATLQGPVGSPVVEARVRSEALGLLGAQLGSVSADARLHGSRLSVSKFHGALWGGRVEGEAEMGLAKGGQLRADLVLDGAELDQARIREVRPLPMSGTAWAHLRSRGLLRSPELDLDLEVGQAAIGGLKLGSLEAEAQWSRRAWNASFQALAGAVKGELHAEGPGAGSFSRSRIELKGLDLGATLQGLASAPPSLAVPASAVNAAIKVKDRLQAQGTLTLSLDGPVRSPSLGLDMALVQGKLFLPAGLLALDDPEEGLSFRVQGKLALGLVDGALYFGSGKAPLRLQLGEDKDCELSALGQMPWARRGRDGDLSLALKADLGLLEQLELFGKTKGDLDLRLRIGGTFDNTLGDGVLTVSGFQTSTEGYLAPVKSGILRAQFKGQRIEIEELGFKAGGQVNATGTLDLAGGLRGIKGSLRLRTDNTGLRLSDWPKVGSGNVTLDPLDLAWEGETEPLVIRGKASLSNALVIYGGADEQEEGERPKKARQAPRPLSLDLRVGLGANVWYEKRQHKSVDFFDPAKALSGAWSSLAETFLQPDLFFRLRSTDKDFVISGTSPEVRISGELAIDRGRMTMMENDFNIRSEQTASKIVFQGQRAEIWADATARLRYMRYDEAARANRTNVVTVRAEVRPLPEEELAKTNLANSRLNYHLARFVSEPRIIQGDDALERSAILNLVVFGDPMVDQQGSGGVQIRRGGSENVALETQLNRALSAEARKQVAKWSRYGFKFLGNNFIDVFRLVPRFKYQSAGGSQGGAQTSAGEASRQAQESSLVWSDLTLEVGKSLGEKLYASSQLVFFGDSSSIYRSPNQDVPTQGLRAGLEYQVSPNRTLELYYNYRVDDNLEAVPFDRGDLGQAHSAALRLRNTIPTDNYSTATALRRRWEMEAPTP